MDTARTIIGGALLLFTLGGIFALAWHGAITGGEALAAVGVIATTASGALAVHTGVKAGAAAASTAPTDKTTTPSS